MKKSYAQKSSTVQKAAAPNAASVLDSSAQNESLQRKADMANNAAQRAEAPRPNNTGMPDNLKAGIESLSGFSMDDVRVHYNSSKPATVQALAYTQGTDIHVAPGQEKHLPHEAWHVAQQMAGRVSPTTNINGMPVNDNAALEHEADVMGEKAVQMKGKGNFVNECDAYNLQTVQLQSRQNFTNKHVNKPVMQFVAWDAEKKEELTVALVRKIYKNLTEKPAEGAVSRPDAASIEGNTGGFNRETVERLKRLGENMKKIPHEKTEWWWVRVMLKDPEISRAVKKTRIKSAEVPDEKTNLKGFRNARARNAIYFHATSLSLVDTIMQNGLTTSVYRSRNNLTNPESGLAANADENAKLYQEESLFSVYVTGRYNEAKQYKKSIDEYHKKKSTTPEDKGVIIFPILTNADEDFEVDADSTGIKTAPSSNSSSNYPAIGTKDLLNSQGLKLMELAVGPAIEDVDDRTPLQVFQSQLPKDS